MGLRYCFDVRAAAADNQPFCPNYATGVYFTHHRRGRLWNISALLCMAIHDRALLPWIARVAHLDLVSEGWMYEGVVESAGCTLLCWVLVRNSTLHRNAETYHHWGLLVVLHNGWQLLEAEIY